MKRMASLLMAAALAVSLTLPAAAAGESTQDARLAKVTQTVKDTLDLNTDQYDSFTGNCEEQGSVSQWSLFWEGGIGSLSIEALEDGTITGYFLNTVEAEEPGLPSLAGDQEQARQAAQDFLDKVLDPALESVQVEEPTGQTHNRGQSYFSGTILLNGLPSPMWYSISVDGRSGQVVSFYRDAAFGSYMGEVPSATPAVSRETAAQSLKTTLPLKLEYVLPQGEGNHAVLRYVPDSSVRYYEYYVDAQTGELVNLTELEEDMGNAGGDSSGGSPESTTDSAENGLSQAEQEGIQKLEGVLPSDTLDEQLRAVSEYGLKDYTLAYASYNLVEATEDREEQVLCTLRYLLPGDKGTASRTFTVDARSGQVERLWSYLPWEEEQKPAITQAQAQQRAEAFLSAFCPQDVEKLALYQGPEGEVRSTYSFTFARQENGYFFPAQYYTVGISAEDGTVCRVSYFYDEEVTFDSPDGIISQQAALDAWMDTYTVTLGYLQVPVKLDANDAEAAPYLQMGMKSFYVLKLGYVLEREEYCPGIDAKTGKPVQWETAGESSDLAYTDIDGHWAQGTIETLARQGVGYAGQTFAPDQAMTQWDLICLLYSVENYLLDPAEVGDAEKDAAYNVAYRMGVLTPTERQEDAPLTRSQAVKLLLNAEGLKAAAQLSGIYTCSYPDAASIPAEDLGYAALAQGIGMIQGAWAGERIATRAEGAVMLYQLLAW